MGGAVRTDGNTTPLGEFNIYADPHAAQIVFDSGMPITLMPWDITSQVQFTSVHVKQLLARGGPIPAFIEAATRFYIEFHLQEFGWAACSINDPAALALIWWPELAQTRDVFITVETGSELTMGKTVADFKGKLGRAPNVRLVEAFDGPEFVRRFVVRIEALIDRLSL
jgi:purine nucleosidase